MTHKSRRCPNCGRALTEEEIYCHFCEMEIEKMEKWHKKSGKNH